MEILPIQTARLVLRRFTTADLDAFQAYRSDLALARYQGWEPISADQAHSFLADQTQQVLGPAGQWLQVALTRRDTGEVIGDLGLCVIDERESIVELGFTLARKEHGQGYATEAVRGVLDALFSRGQARSVVANSDIRNTASVALLQRVGFTPERTTATEFKGEPCEEVTFIITDDQWARGQTS